VMEALLAFQELGSLAAYFLQFDEDQFLLQIETEAHLLLDVVLLELELVLQRNDLLARLRDSLLQLRVLVSSGFNLGLDGGADLLLLETLLLLDLNGGYDFLEKLALLVQFGVALGSDLLVFDQLRPDFLFGVRLGFQRLELLPGDGQFQFPQFELGVPGRLVSLAGQRDVVLHLSFFAAQLVSGTLTLALQRVD